MSIALSGCFDLTQQVQIGRAGAGSYRLSIAASGLMGQALKERPAQLAGLPPPQRAVDTATGVVRQTSQVDFRALADLKLADEVMSLHVLERPVFGLGPAHVRFHRTFLIGAARNHQAAESGQSDVQDAETLASMFANHRYVFSVHLPGSVLKADPVHLGSITIAPTVTGDLWHGHTITWTMPLGLALSQQMLRFTVDFSAYGHFTDTQSQPLPM